MDALSPIVLPKFSEAVLPTLHLGKNARSILHNIEDYPFIVLNTIININEIIPCRTYLKVSFMRFILIL
jgi:hypothetical protein